MSFLIATSTSKHDGDDRVHGLLSRKLDLGTYRLPFYFANLPIPGLWVHH